MNEQEKPMDEQHTDPTGPVAPEEPTTDEATTDEETEPDAEPATEAATEATTDEEAEPAAEPVTEPVREEDTAVFGPAARAAYEAPGEDRPRSGRHPVNVGHLVMGLAFAGLVGIWALVAGDVIDNEDVRWLLPLPWVLAGVAGLLAITLGGRRRRA
jgi:hypothetical protein